MNGHINAILNYTNTNPASTNIPKWDISCPKGDWDSWNRIASCKNWYAYEPGTDRCYMKTKLIGRGKGKLDFGNCWKGQGKGIVKVSLDSNVIATAQNGADSETMEFDFTDGNELKLSEENIGVIMFNSFKVLNCEGKILRFSLLIQYTPELNC